MNRKISDNFEFEDMEDNVSENGEFETLDKDENSKTKNLPVHDIIDHSSSVSDHSHQLRNHSNYQEYYNNIPVRDFPIIPRLLGRLATIKLNSLIVIAFLQMKSNDEADLVPSRETSVKHEFDKLHESNIYATAKETVQPGRMSSNGTSVRDGNSPISKMSAKYWTKMQK